jgi:D-alanyl-D-alanine carboxypeptidase (penicillin-binding protein 5/6)
VSVRDLINGIVTLSGNDASVVLAEGIAGSEAAFVQRMNAKAKQLGMTRSRFGTSNGWPDNGRTRTTARDLAILVAATLRKYPELYRRYYARPAFAWNGISQPNRNPILGRVKGADGLKTGHTEEAGYCFAGSAQQDGRRLVMIIAGTISEAERAAASVQLMQSGFTDWRARTLVHKQRHWAMAKVQAGAAAQVALVTPPNARWLQPKGTAAPAKISVNYQGPVAAPVAKGQRLGALVLEHPSGFRQHIPLLAAQSVSEAGFFRRAWLGLLQLLRIA